MPLYGDLDHCAKMLRATETWDLGNDITDRLGVIQAAVSLQLEDACGRTWGSPVSDTSVLHWVGPFDTLVLNTPARSLTSITTGGTVSGSTMTGGTVTLAADLANRITSHDGLIYAVTYSVNDPWPGPVNWNVLSRVPVLVTGDFADTDDDATVPADVEYAANFLIVEQLKRENAGPAGFTGPDGSTTPIRNPWKDDNVTRVIDKYSLRKRPLAV